MQALLQRILSGLPTTLDADRLSAVFDELEEDCLEVMKLIKQLVEERVRHTDRAVLTAAVQEALACFNMHMERIAPGCPDVAMVDTICKVLL